MHENWRKITFQSKTEFLLLFIHFNTSPTVRKIIKEVNLKTSTIRIFAVNYTNVYLSKKPHSCLLLTETLSSYEKSIIAQIYRHNNAVNRSGFCATCRRAGGEFSGKAVKRGTKAEDVWFWG